MNKLTFNTTGPCVAGEHYMLDPFRGINDDLMRLIDGKNYFVIHAARQVGKTTLLKSLVRDINSVGKYYALYCSLEAMEKFTEPEKGMPEIVKTIGGRIEDQGLPDGFAANADYSNIAGVLRSSFVRYCRSLDKPFVVFFDEADCLANGTLITFLRQLREGYINRADTPFIHSLALVGMRNLRDYKVRVRPDSESTGAVSPFNIVAKTFNLRCFNREEAIELYAQHTSATGQIFEQQMVDYVFDQTQGQPWLVNAIARECVEEILQNDHSIPITQAHAEQAIQRIVRDKRTHIDSMMNRLKEPRIRKVIMPLLLGEDIFNKTTDDYEFTRDMGLIREVDGGVEPANPIYAEMIIKTLSDDAQDLIQRKHKEYRLPRYIKDGKFDMEYLIKDFQAYWRENSDIWTKKYETEYYQYDEAAAHLVMQAFMIRVMNGGGQVIRNTALGTKLADLCIIYEEQKYPIELKILQNQRSYAKSLAQTREYVEKCGCEKGWLMLFDKDAEKSWDDKIYMKEEIVDGKRIVVAGC